MMITVEGIYRNGAVEITESPPNVKEARVLVIFLPPDTETHSDNVPMGQRIQHKTFPGLKSVAEED